MTLQAGAKGHNYSPHTVPHVLAYGVSENQRAESRLTPYSRQITTGGGKPGQGYPCALVDYKVRRLTPCECERLQGFPDDWTAVNGMSDSARYRMLGNAVAVPVAEWIGQRIYSSHNENYTGGKDGDKHTATTTPAADRADYVRRRGF